MTEPQRVNNNVGMARAYKPILADSNAQLPYKIEIMRVGEWNDSIKGNLTIVESDLVEMKANFDNGVGMSGGAGFGLPIDFAHNDHLEAAGWMTELSISEGVLYAHVDWSSAGETALKGKLYKCFSPSFWPGCLGTWEDPEDPTIKADNVLVGGALTNIPFFKGLKPIMASNHAGDRTQAMYINANQNKELQMATLEEVLAKEASTLTQEEKDLIVANVDKLTDEQKTAHGIEVKIETPVNENENEEEEVPTPTPVEDKEAVAVAASIKAGQVIGVPKAEYEALKASQVKFETKEAESIVQTHVARGAIKADAVSRWTNRLVSAHGKVREELEADLAALPDNKILASEIGSDKNATPVSASAELRKLAHEAIKADATLNISTAMSKVVAENPELATQYQTEVTTNKVA